MVDAIKTADTPPVDLAARKIMRRGDDKSGTNTTANSENPSKATSEAEGSDGGNDAGSKSKDKSALTREEREARYREARQRIFGNAGVEEGESPEAGTSTEEKDASRSSSASGKKKSKKHRNQDDDDGFEARSRYNAYYPGHYAAPGYTGDSTVYYGCFPGPAPNSQYAPIHSNASPPQSYNGGYPPMMSSEMQSQYGWSNQQYPPPNGPMMYPAYGQQMPNGYDPSADFQRGMQPFQTANMPNQMTPKMANASMAGYQDPYAQPAPNMTMNPGWPQMNQQPTHPMPQGPFPSNGSANRPMTAPMQGVPPSYPFGQFPSPAFNANPTRHQHPIPGSYQRPQFNPQSQSFIPNGPNMPFAMPSNVGGPQTMNNYGGYQMPGNTQMSHQMPRLSPPSANTSNFGSPGHMNNTSASVSSSSPSGQPASTQNPSVPAQSSIAKYGTPSNLPARPPPTQQSAPKFNLAGHNIGPLSRTPSNPLPPFPSNGVLSVSVRGGGNGSTN
jgi:hypothetical protein